MLVRERSMLAAPFVRSSSPVAELLRRCGRLARDVVSRGEHLDPGDRLACLRGSGRRHDDGPAMVVINVRMVVPPVSVVLTGIEHGDLSDSFDG